MDCLRSAPIAGLAFATWLVSLWRRDVSIVDGMWPVFIASAGILYAATAVPLAPPAWLPSCCSRLGRAALPPHHGS